MATANTNVKLQNSEKYTCGTSTTGVHRMVDNVAPLQYPTGLLQSSLKYCRVVAQVAHQVVTMITVAEAKVAIME
jgi:hypothetical protein